MLRSAGDPLRELAHRGLPGDGAELVARRQFGEDPRLQVGAVRLQWRIGVGVEVDRAAFALDVRPAVPLHLAAVAVGGVEHLEGAAGEVDRGDTPGVAALADGGAKRRLTGARIEALRLLAEQEAQHVEVMHGAVQQHHLVELDEVVAALGALEREPGEVCHAQLAQERFAQGAGTQQVVRRLDVREVAVLLRHGKLDAGLVAGGDHLPSLLAGQRHRLFHQRMDARGRAGEHDVEPVVGGGGAHGDEVEALGLQHGANIGIGAPEAEPPLEFERRRLVNIAARHHLEQVAVGGHVPARNASAPDQSKSQAIRHATSLPALNAASVW